MIGSSLSLCYPQITVLDLLYHRAHVPGLPLDKTYPTGGSLRVFRQLVWLEVGSGKAALSRPTHQRVTHTVGRARRDES